MAVNGFPLPEQIPRERKTLDLVVLLSGGGTTMANLADAIAAGDLDARINLVVSSRKKAAGMAVMRWMISLSSTPNSRAYLSALGNAPMDRGWGFCPGQWWSSTGRARSRTARSNRNCGQR